MAKSAFVLAIGKEAFYRQAELDLDAAYGYTATAMTRNMLLRETEAGIDAFIEKRPMPWAKA
jgi:enoyl-CoA hydratase/carnithine racemase